MLRSRLEAATAAPDARRQLTQQVSPSPLAPLDPLTPPHAPSALSTQHTPTPPHLRQASALLLPVAINALEVHRSHADVQAEVARMLAALAEHDGEVRSK